MEESEPNNLTLELGDIIEIVAPTNEDIHESSFYIKYIDNSKIKLINISSLQPHTLIIENGKMTDESITQISLLSRSPVRGYAKQNGLVMKKWVNVYFSGELPVVIAGEITNVEEDMIEITTYPELDVIYIDFEYKGLPQDIPIEKIIISQKPRALAKIDSILSLKENEEDSESDSKRIVEYSKDGTMYIDIPENVTPDENIFDALQCMYSKSKGIVFGEYLDVVTQMVEIPEHEKRYGIDLQLNSLNDELLSTIPNSRRTSTIMNNVQLLVQRFKELREMYSKFDKNDNVRSYKKLDTYKPIVDSIVNLDKKMSWIIPVAKRMKKMYDVDNLMDVDDIQIYKIDEELEREYKTQTETYYENKVKTDDIKYASMYSQTHDFSVPFINSNADHTGDHIAFNPIQVDMEAIVSNFDDFESTTIANNMQIVKKKYVLQKYNVGLTKMTANTESMDKIVYERNPMTPNDSMKIKSFVTFPESTMLFSKINMPTTSILDRANLHHFFLDLDRLLHNKKEMLKIDIQDINKDLDYENLEKEGKLKFLSETMEFVMNEIELEKYSNTGNKFKRFITSIVPKTEVLIRLMKKYIKHGYSVVDFVSYLEPFLVYEKNITYRDYKEIRHYIIQRILEYNKVLDVKMKEYKKYEEHDFRVDPEIMPMMKMFKENPEIMDIFLKTYALINATEETATKSTKIDVNMNSIEILNKVYHFDNGTLFCMLLSFQLISLYTPSAILGDESTMLEDMGENEKIRAPNCIQRVIAKKYNSVSDLQKDNHSSDVFYDKEYDDTPYSIISKYKDDIKKLDPEIVPEFIAENLIEKHSCPKELAPQLTTWLIEGKKRVGEGEYALLEIRPKLHKKIDETTLSEKEKEEISIESEAKAKVQYYKRRKNNWVLDNEVGEESFIDSTTLFCNIAKKCYQRNKNMDDPKTQINKCENVADAAQRMKNIAKKKAINEFDTRYSMSVDDLKKKMDTEIKNHIKHVHEMKRIQKKQLYKTNKYAYLIGSNLDNTTEILISPNASLLELILSQSDFSKKQNDIVKFYHIFCREPMVAELNEDLHWKYCLKTNTKLLPGFLYTLADVYVSGGNYKMKLDEICHSHGNLGEDGEAIVDKYSGRVIRKIDYVNEEGFNPEMQQNITNEDIMAQQLNSAELEKMGKKPALVFEDKNTQLVYNIFSNLASHVGIPIENIKDIVLRLSLEFIRNPKCVNTRESYAILEAKTEKTKGKKIPPYESYFNSSVIFIVSSVFLIALQTAIPTFSTKKTFPGCLRSFAGYPMDGIENTSGIRYISCILEKSKSSIVPWDSIKKLKTDVLVDRIKIVIEKYIILNPEITDLYNTKRDYLLLTPDTIIPDDHNVTNWLSFNPPLISTNISGKIPSVSKDFKDEFYKSIKESHKNQHTQLLELKSKILLYSYSVVEAINYVVYQKDQLLKTASGVPFIENACCNEDENLHMQNVMSYFIKEDAAILNNFKTSIELSNVVNFVKNLSMAQLLFYDKNTRIQIPKIPGGFIEQNIYALVIKKCNLDNDFPIPEIFKMFMTEKPAEYDRKWSIDQKMDFFKRNGKQFDSGDMHQLMRIINSENAIEMKNKAMSQPIEILKNIINIFNDANSNIIVGAFRDKMLALLETYNPNAMISESSDELRALKNYLIRANDLMSKNIMEFLMEHSKASNQNLRKIEAFIRNIQNWNLDIDMKESGKYYDEGLYASTNFVKHAIYDMTRVFPGIIVNDVKFKHISKHWGFSQFHEADLYKYINSYYTPLESFKNDEIFNKMLFSIKEKFTNISMLLEYIPLDTPIVKDNITYYGLFDKRAIYLIYVYCFYAIIQEYMLTTKDDNLVVMTNNALKQGRRNDILKTRDAPMQLIGSELDLDDDLAEEYENLEEYDIITANKEELDEKIAKLLFTFLTIESGNKEVFDLSYMQISKKIRRSKDKEKKSIMKYLQNMTIEERKVEKHYKKYKLDRWNVGQQKGLVIYDPKTYDRERNEMVEKDVDEIVLNMFEYGEIESRDVNQLEEEYEEDVNMMYENEGYDISNLREDYMDDYYGEEGNDDFPED